MAMPFYHIHGGFIREMRRLLTRSLAISAHTCSLLMQPTHSTYFLCMKPMTAFHVIFYVCFQWYMHGIWQSMSFWQHLVVQCTYAHMYWSLQYRVTASEIQRKGQFTPHSLRRTLSCPDQWVMTGAATATDERLLTKVHDYNLQTFPLTICSPYDFSQMHWSLHWPVDKMFIPL